MTLSRMRARLIAAGSAVAAGAVITVIALAGPSVAAGPALDGAQAAASIPVSIKQASLSDHAGDCPGGATGAHIILNQISPESAAPATITVTVTGGGTVSVPLAKYTGSTAHYNVPLTPGHLVTNATASVPSTWTGQFVLSHYMCGPTTTTTAPPTTVITTTTVTATATTTVTVPTTTTSTATVTTTAPTTVTVTKPTTVTTTVTATGPTSPYPTPSYP
jgi:hypothetical protein